MFAHHRHYHHSTARYHRMDAVPASGTLSTPRMPPGDTCVVAIMHARPGLEFALDHGVAVLLLGVQAAMADAFALIINEAGAGKSFRLRDPNMPPETMGAVEMNSIEEVMPKACAH